MRDAITFITKSDPLRLAVDCCRGIVAALAKGKGCDGGGEINALVRGRVRGGVLFLVAGETYDGTMADAKDGGGGGKTAVAYGPDADKAGHEPLGA